MEVKYNIQLWPLTLFFICVNMLIFFNCMRVGGASLYIITQTQRNFLYTFGLYESLPFILFELLSEAWRGTPVICSMC